MRPSLRIIQGAALAGAAALTYAHLVERHLFRLRRVTVPILQTTADPLRILHLSDLHLLPGQHDKIQWVRKLADHQPDLVIATGDNLGCVDAVPGVLRALEPLLALPGAFVFGSNDYNGPVVKNPFGYFNRNRRYVQGTALPSEELRDALIGAGWVDCNNARATIKAGSLLVDLVGVDDPHIGRDIYPVPQANPDTVNLRLGLVHSPEPRILETMSFDGCSIIFAGHTHGGQVRVPFYGALVTNCGLEPKLARGLHPWRDSETYLHVSAGLGTHSTAPIRFSCPPEATILTLVPRCHDNNLVISS